MPELPEVQTVVDTLRPHVEGRVLLGVTLHREDFGTPIGHDWSILAGLRVLSLHRRAKRIVFSLEGGDRFYGHLGMTGRMTFEPADAEVKKHTHATLAFDGGEVRCVDSRRFGGLVWLGSSDDGARLGPEPLTMRSQQLADRLLRTRRPLKSALLDQTFVAGLGNIYVDEALFAAGLHPLTACCDVDRPTAGRLSRAIKLTLNKAIRHKGSTLRDYVDAAGNKGGFQKLHRVYDRAGAPCRRCRTAIERFVLGGRSTHFCPRCQPALTIDA